MREKTGSSAPSSDLAGKDPTGGSFRLAPARVTDDPAQPLASALRKPDFLFPFGAAS